MPEGSARAAPTRASQPWLEWQPAGDGDQVRAAPLQLGRQCGHGVELPAGRRRLFQQAMEVPDRQPRHGELNCQPARPEPGRRNERVAGSHKYQ